MITAGEGEKQTQWLIKGIVRNAEYVYYAPEGLTIPDYHKYGFAYTNASSLPNVAFNEIILTVNDGQIYHKKKSQRKCEKRWKVPIFSAANTKPATVRLQTL
jgi:hypothetical protein